MLAGCGFGFTRVSTAHEISLAIPSIAKVLFGQFLLGRYFVCKLMIEKINTLLVCLPDPIRRKKKSYSNNGTKNDGCDLPAMQVHDHLDSRDEIGDSPGQNDKGENDAMGGVK